MISINNKPEITRPIIKDKKMAIILLSNSVLTEFDFKSGVLIKVFILRFYSV